MSPSTSRTLPGLTRILRSFAPYMRKQRALIAGSFLALLAEAALRVLEPWPLKIILDDVIVERPRGSSSGGGPLGALDPTTLLTVSAVAILVIAGLRAAASYASKVGFALAGNRILTEVRTELYRHLQRLSLAYHTKARTGDLTTRLTGDVGRLQEVTVTAALPLAGNVLTLVGMLGVMLWLNWQLGLLALTALPLFALLTVRFGGSIQAVARRQRQREGALAATAAESLSAIKVVQALSLESTLERTFSNQNEASLREGVKATRLSSALERSVDLAVAVAMALVVWWGSRLALAGAITPGELVLFVFYLKSAFKPLRDLAKYTGRIAKATASGERVLDVLEHTPAIGDRPDALHGRLFRGHVRFEEVSFEYEPATEVLRGVDFEVLPGARVGLAGPSGGGKSSLAGLLLRLYDPVRGRITIDGRDLRDYSLESVRAQISVVLQESVLFAVSARENIAYGAPGASDEQIEAAARLANAHAFVAALPEGYDTILGERGATLSGGERQRIAIARAALRDAPIVILDEPTTGLDRENARAVGEALDRLACGRTTFLIAHDLATIEDADLILFLEDGRIVERGRHEELMRLGGRYAGMYELQSARRRLRESEAVAAALSR